MSWIAAAVGIGTAAAGIFGASKAAGAQKDAANTAAATERYMYDTTREDMAPWQEKGEAAVNQMGSLMGFGGSDERTEALNQFYQDPGYNFRFNEGQRAVENSAASRGGMLSGNTLRELATFGQGMGSGEYGNYWNRLAGLSGTGQTATNQLGGFGMNAARGIGNANLAAGQARGSGYIGMADSVGSGLNTYANMKGWEQMGRNWGQQPYMVGNGWQDNYGYGVG